MKNTVFKVGCTNELITLMNVYLTEWMHRDSLLWKQIFAYFFAILVFVILPFSDGLGVSFDNILPKPFFPIIGLLLSFIFLVISKGYADRLKAIGDTYVRLINMLPEKYRRDTIKTHIRLSYFITYTMFAILIILSITI